MEARIVSTASAQEPATANRKQLLEQGFRRKFLWIKQVKEVRILAFTL
jgi:hypothetical protein